MATSAAWQAELNSLLMGAGTDYPFVSVDVTPPEIRSNDLPRLLADGDFQGSQFYGPLYVTLVMDVEGSSESDLLSNMASLQTAWAKSSTDVTFELNLPFHGARTCQGRAERLEIPEFVEATVAGWVIRNARARFKAGTPTWTSI